MAFSCGHVVQKCRARPPPFRRQNDHNFIFEKKEETRHFSAQGLLLFMTLPRPEMGTFITSEIVFDSSAAVAIITTICRFVLQMKIEILSQQKLVSDDMKAQYVLQLRLSAAQ